ncbi:MAG: hypothetical protein ACRDZ8_16790 [Acidimicrobiales bacterium]
MRAALLSVAVLVVAVAVGLGVAEAVHHQPDRPTTVSTTTTTLPAEIVPGANQVFVTGKLTSLSADNAEGPPLTPPFTITIPVRGAGSADLTGVSIDGKPVEISWYGGQPLPVSGGGQLVIGGGRLTVNPAGITWILDGAARTLAPGHYFLGAPVAVGASGLATPEQTASFDAGADSTMLTTGGAQIHLSPAALHITGPGSVMLTGTLQVQSPTATRAAASVTFGPGDYDITLTPTSGGDTINATLQGPYGLG